MRHIARNLILNILSLNAKPASGIHILNGHYVENDINKYSVQKFENFIKWIGDNYQYISLPEAVDLIENGQPVTNPYVTLTLDDGFEECYTIMFPVLEKYGCKAAFFINPESISDHSSGFAEKFIADRLKVPLKKRFMNWSMVNEMIRAGHIIGSHTVSHAALKNLSPDELDLQVVGSKQIIEHKTGLQCKYFAFPFGTDQYFDVNAATKVSETYEYAFTSGRYTKYRYGDYANLITRRHFECNWPFSHIRYFTSKKRTHT
jgi:peptidoglycan/xylan/chitin deacetylase (PgdA/CDA1 family)